jgi:uncharacterized protein (DUF983 family)
MKKKKKVIIESDKSVTTKKCPYCYTYLKVEADRCDSCGKRIGEVDSVGWAKKPFDAAGYLLAVAACGGLVWFVWWAFLK